MSADITKPNSSSLKVNVLQEIRDNYAPLGSVLMYAPGSPPSGWLACDGAAISRSTYAALFALLGTTYGAGDGSTTFNVPYLRGRAPIGSGAGSGLTARNRGDKSGEETHQLSGAELAVHTHTQTAHGHTVDITDPGHNHSITDAGHVHPQKDYNNNGGGFASTANSTVSSYQNNNTDTATTGISINSHVTNITASTDAPAPTIQNAGSGIAHNNMQPFLCLGFIIRAY